MKQRLSAPSCFKMDWDKLESELKSFDYTYMMSDDYGVWKCGEQEEVRVRRLVEIAKKINLKKTLRLINKYKHDYGTHF